MTHPTPDLPRRIYTIALWLYAALMVYVVALCVVMIFAERVV